MSDMRLVVAGAGGRMGRTLVKAIAEAKGFALAGALEDARSPLIGWDAGTLAGLGENGIKLTGDAGALMDKADGIIDFTAPSATVAFAALAAKAQGAHHRHHRLERGRRGQDQGRRQDRGDRQVRQHEPRRQPAGGARQARRQDARQFLRHRNPEMHHNQKVDAPSGTALLLGRAAAEGRGIELDKHKVESRDGHTGARKPGDIGFDRCAAAAWSASTA